LLLCLSKDVNFDGIGGSNDATATSTKGAEHLSSVLDGSMENNSSAGSDQPVSTKEGRSEESMSRNDESDNLKTRSSEQCDQQCGLHRFFPSAKIHFFVLGLAIVLL